MSSEHDDDARTGEDTGTAEEHGRDEDRGSARRSRLMVASVAAAVLLAGGGGAWWAAASGGGSHGSGARPSGQGEPRNADALDGSPVPGATYKLTGTLPGGGPKSAPVYRPSARVSQDAVRKLASVLGLSGPVVDDQALWRVGAAPGTGAGPVLTVAKEGPGTWSYLRAVPPVPHMRPNATVKHGPAASPGTGSGSGPAPVASHPSPSGPAPGTSSTSDPAPGTSGAPVPRPAGRPSPATLSPLSPDTVITLTATATDDGRPPVSEQKAMSAAAPVLAGLGLSGARTDASLTLGSTRTVTADPVVGGLPTSGWDTRLEIGRDGRLDMGYGRLAPLAAGDSYPVDSAAAAFKRLSAESAAGGTACAAPLPSSTRPADDRKLPLSSPCMSAGSHRTMEVRGAAFGLSAQFMSGTQELVPSWLFDTAPATVRTTTVVAEPAVPSADLPGGPGVPAPGRSGPGGSVPGQTPSPGVNPGGPVVPGPGMPSDPRAVHVPVTGYRASGTTLTLTYFGGLCDTYKATADETASQVRVSLTAAPKRPARVCPMIARSFTVTVQLKQPLGNRTVVNAEDGRPVKGQ